MNATGSASPHIVLVVVTYNSRDLLDEFVAALPAATSMISAEVLMVDNASSDGTVEHARTLPAIDRILELGDNFGYAAGINAGIAAASGDAFLVLNPDIRLGEGAVVALWQRLSSPSVGITGPRLNDEHGQLLTSLRRQPSIGRALGEALIGGRRAGRYASLGEVVVDPGAYECPTVADWATGGAMLISAACSQEVGLWDERFFLYSEEVDFARRAQDHGFRIQLAPEARATRIVGIGPSSDFIWCLMQVNRYRLFARSHSVVRTTLFRAVLMLGEALRSLVRGRRHRAGLRSLRRPLLFLEEAGLVGPPPRPRAGPPPGTT